MTPPAKKPRKPKEAPTYRILALFGTQVEIEQILDKMAIAGWNITPTRIEATGTALGPTLYHFFGLAKKP